MNGIEEFIVHIEKSLKDLVKTSELVRIGMYSSPQAAFHARQMGCSPPFFKIAGNGVVYPKCGVIEFLRSIGHAQLPVGTKSAKSVGTGDPDLSLNAQKQA